MSEDEEGRDASYCLASAKDARSVQKLNIICRVCHVHAVLSIVHHATFTYDRFGVKQIQIA